MSWTVNASDVMTHAIYPVSMGVIPQTFIWWRNQPPELQHAHKLRMEAIWAQDSGQPLQQWLF